MKLCMAKSVWINKPKLFAPFIFGNLGGGLLEQVARSENIGDRERSLAIVFLFFLF